MMRAVWILTFILSSGGLSSAQDKPLGDIAREAHADKSQSTHAAKVVTNDDFGPHLEPIASTENPVDVVNKARLALMNDHTHSCLRKTSGNSGPGWTDSRVTEVAGPDRTHVVTNASSADHPQDEYIIIGKDVYNKIGNAPWQRMGTAETQFVASLDFTLPDVLKFGYQSEAFTLIGPETVDGFAALRYEDKIRAGDMDRTIDIWVRASDHLPLRTHMLTVTTSSVTAPITWQETWTCSYGQTFKIDPPM
jgi:hypothetical protein